VASVNRPLKRRAFLRGLGMTLALPWLEAGEPGASAPHPPPVRMGFFYVPNGVVMENWKPKASGADFAFPPILKPLEPLKSSILVLSDLAADHCENKVAGHENAGGGFLVGAKCKRSEEPESGGISVDQLAARTLGGQTPVDALTLGVDTDIRGDFGYSGTYLSHLSWRGPTSPAPVEINPQVLFDRLFRSQLARSPARAQSAAEPVGRSLSSSVLDLVREDAATLRRNLGARDRDKLDDYLDGLRAIERRLDGGDLGVQATAGRQDAGIVAPAFPAGSGIPAVYADHVNLMLDILVLAFQADITRVSTFMFGAEKSDRAYPEIGAPGSHHSTSHHNGKPENLAELTRINTHHVTLFARLLQRLQQVKEGDGTLLDHVVFCYGGGISDGAWHNHNNLPIILAGGGGGTLTGGRHISYGRKTPICNLYLDMLARAGVPLERFGDSSGRLAHLS
jgi:hypothetical protein